MKILMPVTAILLVLALVLNYVMNYFDYIMDAYIGAAKVNVEQAEGTEGWDTSYYDTSMSEEDAANATRDVVLQIAEEGFVLLKNKDDKLPLTETDAVSVFGWAFSHPVYGGTGTGSSDASTAISPKAGLENSGFSVNGELEAEYEKWSKANNATQRPSDATMGGDYWTLPEMPVTKELVEEAAAYSDTAIIWIARQGGEGQDEALNMDVSLNGETDVQKGYSTKKHYLELTDAEESMIAAVEANEKIENIIVIVNSSNAMELAELENDPNIDGILLAGAGGCTGFNAIGEILRGTVSPSGKNTDTYYANFKLDPTYQNFGDPTLYESEGPTVNYYGDDDLFEDSAEGYIDEGDVMPTTGAENGIQLINMRGLDYEDELWEKFLDQLTVDEMEELICGGSYASQGIDRLGIPSAADGDGPASIKWMGSAGDTTGILASQGSQALPSETVMACTWNVDLMEEAGIVTARKGLLHGCSGWYAPGLDTHRSPFGGRNFEYFSEDPYLAGTLCAAEVSGAASQGVYAYVKHFVMNDQETFRNLDATGNWAKLNRSFRFMGQMDDVIICTWVSEQAIREIYCKAFELVVKNASCEMKYISDDEGTVSTKTMPACTAIMSGFCYIGDTWCGANEGLLGQLLRDEWGFTGTVLTDAAAYPYMSQDNFVFNDGDLLLAIGQNKLLDITKKSASGVIQMRRAVKNQMYTKANSNAVNGIAPNSVITTGIAPWQYLGWGIIAACALFFAIVWGRFVYGKVSTRKK